MKIRVDSAAHDHKKHFGSIEENEEATTSMWDHVTRCVEK